MAKRTGPTNQYLKKLIEDLRKKSLELNSPIWGTIADKLENPRRKKVEVNLSDINRNASDGDTVVVPGVVLGSGAITKSVNVAAWKFSSNVSQKIKKAKGKCMTIEDLIKENPKGTGVKILV